jgi:hypothetical protein
MEGQVPVPHACNPRYSEGNDQENCSSKPDPAKFARLYPEKTLHKKKGLGEWLKV